MRNELSKGVLWLTGAKLVVNVLALTSTFVLARLLTPEDFGLVAIATTMLAVLTAVTEMSLASALIHHAAPSEEHFDTAWTMNMIRSAIIAVAFAAAAPLAASYYKDDRLVTVMVMLSISIFMGGTLNPKIVTLTRNLVFWQEFAVVVAQKLAGFVVGVALALIYKSYWALLGGILASQGVALVVSYMVVKYRPRFSLKHSRELWSFSMWLTLGQMVNTLNWKFDNLLIGAKFSSSTLGFYTVGDTLAGLPTRETTAPIQQTLFPGFRMVIGDPLRLRRAYQRAQEMISAVALPAGFVVALLAEPLVRLVLGEKWLEATQVVEILACVFAVQTMATPVQPLGLAKGATKTLFLRDAFSLCMRVPLIIAGAYWGGVQGILYARLLTGFAAIYINMLLVRNLIALPLMDQLMNSKRSLTSIAVMVLVHFGLIHASHPPHDNWLQLLSWTLVHSAIYVAIYLGTHVLLWLLEKRPDGVEREVINVCQKLTLKYRN